MRNYMNCRAQSALARSTWVTVSIGMGDYMYSVTDDSDIDVK